MFKKFVYFRKSFEGIGLRVMVAMRLPYLEVDSWKVSVLKYAVIEMMAYKGIYTDC